MAVRTKPSPRRRKARPLAGGRGVAAALCAAAGLLAACGADPAPEPALPPGIAWVARSAALAGVLADLQGLEGTPLARRAAQILDALPQCPVAESRAASTDPAEALTAMACGAADGPLAALHRQLDSSDFALSIELEGSDHLRAGAVRRADGSLDLELLLPRAAFRGPTALLVPGANPPGPPVLSAEQRLVYARARAARALDLAALVPEASQGAQLFALKSALFAGMVLDGTWELAVYPPEPGSATPRVALALGFTQRAAAVAALEAFLAELRESWPMPRSPFALGDAQGACLLALNLLPDLAPCYVAGERSLVIGWNPASLRVALAPSAGAEDSGASAAQLVVELGRFAEIDARLARLASRSDSLPSSIWPWQRLVASAESSESEVSLRVGLEAAGSQP